MSPLSSLILCHACICAALLTLSVDAVSYQPRLSRRSLLTEQETSTSYSANVFSLESQLNFCELKSYSTACASSHLARRDFYCNSKFRPLRQLLVDYCQRHKAAIAAGPTADGKYVVAKYDLEAGGMGNRMPGIVSAFFIALATNRTFLLDYPNFYSYFAPPLNYSYDQLLTDVDIGDPALSKMNFLHDNDTEYSIAARDNLEEKYGSYKAWVVFNHADYLAAPIISNPHYREFVRKYFPSWEVFWPLSHLLFKPLAPRLQTALQSYRDDHGFGAQAYVVGYQVRMVKLGSVTPFTPRFHNLARGVAAGVGGNSRPVKYFVTADNKESYEEAERVFGKDAIFTEAAQLLNNLTKASNPGTEESGIIDMAILSSCNAIIISMSSSFGGCAAGLGGHHAYYLSDRTEPFDSGAPFYFKATLSEPCWYRGYWAARHLDPDALQHYTEHPMFMQWQQCHYPMERRH